MPTARSSSCPGSGRCPVAVDGIGDITRFRHPARLCSQSGLTPRHYESDTTVIRGRITKQGSPALHWALVEAVQRTPAGTPVRQARAAIIARRGIQARNIAKGRRGPQAAHLRLLRDARRARQALAARPAEQEAR